MEPFNFSFFSITGQVIDLDYCDIEWFALEMNRDHSVIFEIASKYCRRVRASLFDKKDLIKQKGVSSEVAITI